MRHRGQKHSTPLAQVWKCFQRATTYLRSSNTLKGASAMKKSSAIFVSAIALGLRWLCLSKHPPKVLPSTSVLKVTVLVTRPMRLIPPPMATAIQATVMPIQATAMATAVRATALIGAKVDALLAELIGDGIAGIRAYRLIVAEVHAVLEALRANGVEVLEDGLRVKSRGVRAPTARGGGVLGLGAKRNLQNVAPYVAL